MITGFLNKKRTVRVIVADTTKISNDFMNIHKFSYPVSRIMSKFVTGTVLLSSTLKGNDVIGCYLDCNGPATGLRVEANTLGHLKGYALSPQAGLDEFDKTYVLSDEQLVNGGTFTVSKVLEAGKQPFTGNIDFEGGDVAFIFSKYLLVSEQVKSAVLISNIVLPDGSIEKCKGLLVQAMPGATDDELEIIEQAIEKASPFSEIIANSKDNNEIVKNIFKEIQFSNIFEKGLLFKCSCSKFKVISVLKSFSNEDLKDVSDNNGNYTVNCEYCKTEYNINPSELKEQQN